MIPSDDERLLAMLIYVTSFFTVIIGPLLIWLLKRQESIFIDHHGKQYLNFLISYTIYFFIAKLLVILLIGIIVVPIVAIAAFITVIVAAIKAYRGETYYIPFVIHIIR